MSNHFKRNALWMIGIFFLGMLLYFAFFSAVRTEDSTPSTEVENVTGEEEPQVVSKVITLPEDKGNDKKDVNISRKKINLYIIDEKGVNTLPIVSFVSPDSFSPKTVAEAVILALGEKAADTQIGEVQLIESAIYIDLQAKHPEAPFGNIDSKQEEMILDCISYSLLDNFSDYGTIYFKVNGEAYNSKNIKLDKDKPFINQ